MNLPLFSILIAVKDHEKFVGLTLNSIKDQTFKDYEVIVVDDASLDNSYGAIKSVLNSFSQEESSRYKIFRNRDGKGQAWCFDFAFQQSCGLYIALLDSDDLWNAEKLEITAQAIDRNPSAGMFVHPLKVITEGGDWTGEVRPKGAALSQGFLRNAMLKNARHVAPATTGVVIRRQVYNSLMPSPLYSYKSAADAYLTFGASLESTVVVIDEPLGEYRMHLSGNYITRLSSVEGLERQVNIQNEILKRFNLENLASSNSYFARNIYGYRKLRAPYSKATLTACLNLCRSILLDEHFSPLKRVLLSTLWISSMPLPRSIFRHVWVEFQMAQTGLGKVRRRKTKHALGVAGN